MSTLLKGRITEAAVLNAFVRSGRTVLIPFGEGQSYDLAIDLDPGLLRVQCKTARPYSGGLIFNCRATDHGQGNASYEGLADVFGVYFAPEDTVYLVPGLAFRCFPARPSCASSRAGTINGLASDSRPTMNSPGGMTTSFVS